VGVKDDDIARQVRGDLGKVTSGGVAQKSSKSRMNAELGEKRGVTVEPGISLKK